MSFPFCCNQTAFAGVSCDVWLIIASAIEFCAVCASQQKNGKRGTDNVALMECLGWRCSCVCDCQTKDVFNPKQFVEAARNGNKEVLKAHLSKKGANINAVDDFGWTALMKAAQSRNIAGVKFLIDCNANVNHVSPDGRFALLLAAMNDFEDICEELLLQGMHQHAHTHTRCFRTQERTTP